AAIASHPTIRMAGKIGHLSYLPIQIVSAKECEAHASVRGVDRIIVFELRPVFIVAGGDVAGIVKKIRVSLGDIVARGVARVESFFFQESRELISPESQISRAVVIP